MAGLAAQVLAALRQGVVIPAIRSRLNAERKLDTAATAPRSPATT